MKSITQVVQNLLKPYIDNKDTATAGIIAPVETDATKASKAYSIGDQLVLGGILYNVTAPIAKDAALVTTGAGANLSAAGDVTTQIGQAKTMATNAATKAASVETSVAPIEDGTTMAGSYSAGDQFYHSDILYSALTTIPAGTAFSSLTLNTDYEAADSITEQLKNVGVTTDAEPTKNSTNPVQSGGVYNADANIYEVMGKMGAKALLPMSLADIKAKNTTGTWNDNAYAINGVTFTVNTDSDGFITDIAATGTASADATLMVYGYSYTSAYAVTYDTPVIASIDFVGSDSTARGIVWGTNSAYVEATEVQIAAGTLYGFGLRVLNGYEIPVGGITFKPMLRLASDTDDTYQPYAKTNRELTAENQTLTQKIGTTTTKTLAANATSIEFDVPTSGTNLIKFYSLDGSFYTAIDTSVSGKATLTFEASASARTIACQIAQA